MNSYECCNKPPTSWCEADFFHPYCPLSKSISTSSVPSGTDTPVILPTDSIHFPRIAGDQNKSKNKNTSNHGTCPLHLGSTCPLNFGRVFGALRSPWALSAAAPAPWAPAEPRLEAVSQALQRAAFCHPSHPLGGLREVQGKNKPHFLKQPMQPPDTLKRMSPVQETKKRAGWFSGGWVPGSDTI